LTSLTFDQVPFEHERLIALASACPSLTALNCGRAIRFSTIAPVRVPPFASLTALTIQLPISLLIPYLTGIPSLQHLTLSGSSWTNVSGATVRVLEEAQRSIVPLICPVTTLDLRDTNITDVALRYICDISNKGGIRAPNLSRFIMGGLRHYNHVWLGPIKGDLLSDVTPLTKLAGSALTDLTLHQLEWDQCARSFPSLTTLQRLEIHFLGSEDTFMKAVTTANPRLPRLHLHITQKSATPSRLFRWIEHLPALTELHATGYAATVLPAAARRHLANTVPTPVGGLRIVIDEGVQRAIHGDKVLREALIAKHVTVIPTPSENGHPLNRAMRKMEQ